MASFAVKAKRGRPRGFSAWRPRAASRVVVEQVVAVLEEYRGQLPVTGRQIFYRLVAEHGLEKSEQAYERIGRVLTMGRRSGLIPWASIRDDGFRCSTRSTWTSGEEFVETLRVWAESGYRGDRQAGQERRVVLWCEAAGMVPQLERAGAEWTVPVYSSGGFDSVTAKHAVAEQFAAMGRVLVLHVGDHDPSGVHVYGALDEDVRAFLRELGGDVEFRRLAVLPDHVDQYGLPTEPAKQSDRRAFAGRTVQAEALAPDVLAGIVRRAIRAELDLELVQAAVDVEAEQRERVARWASRWGELEE